MIENLSSLRLLKCLYLSNNRIAHIGQGLQGLPHLKLLDLRWGCNSCWQFVGCCFGCGGDAVAVPVVQPEAGGESKIEQLGAPVCYISCIRV